MKKRWLAFVLTIVMLSSNLTPAWNAIALAEENTAVLSSEPVFSDASVEATVSDADASSGDNTLSVIEPLIVSEPVVTAAPTQAPTAAPTPVITEAPTAAPTPVATEAPTAAPTEAPAPVSEPAPIAEGTETPAAEPEATEAPTAEPTEEPEATEAPVSEPAAEPEATEAPVSEPAAEPEATVAPTAEPAKKPETTEAPTAEPAEEPEATMAPTAEPAEKPEATEAPTAEPTATPEATEAPTAEPATTPEATEAPTAEPAITPEATEAPTAEPTTTPEATVLPSVEPSLEPSASPEATVTPTPTPVPDPLVVSISISPSYMTAGGGTISASASISGGLGDYNVALYIFSPYTLDAEKSVTMSAPGNVSISSTPVYGGTHTAEVIVTDASGQQAQASASMVVSEGFPESASVWESSISDVALTDDWVTDILAIARSQIGNREYENCFVVDESGRVRYYTRYGHWYGAPYQDWCAMFVAFCLHYADISTADYPVDAGCTTWKGKLEAIGAYEKTNNAENARRAENNEPLIIDEDAYLPTSGDLIFINHEGEPNPQHVGLVEYVEDGMVYTIEGNACNSVMRREYELTDVTIVGYGNTGLLAQRAKEKEEAQLDNPAQSETIPEQTPMAEGTIGRTTLKKVNMRSHTDVESKLLRTIVEPGTAVSVLFSVDVGSTPWYFVEYDGTNGYIRGDLLSIEEAAPEATVEPTPAPVYYCGSEEHTHAETCYAEDGSIICEFPEHTHTEECLIAPEATVAPTVEPATIYYCGSEEHAHAETCYAEDGSIVCEFTEHTHTEECLIAPEATVVPTVEPAPVYYCGSEEHAHAETCYAEDGSIICEFAEHAHTEECLIAPEATVVPTVESAPVYYCGSEEHAHAETCYAEDGSIICEFPEHAHTEECLVAPEATAEPTPAPVYFCGSEEHAHAETCYAEDGSISCEFTEHTHTEECLIAPEATAEPTPAPVYFCGSEEHVHAQTCYAEDGSIVCEFTEHTHTEECLIALEATVVPTVEPAPVYYCGSEEHAHTEACYAEDGSIICEFPEHAHTEECLIAPEATAVPTPAPVYFCGSEEHVHAQTCYAEDGSIVCEFTEHTHTEECLIAPEATAVPTPAPVYFCGSEEHAHAETCYAEDGSIVCEFPEHTHTEECLIAPEATVAPTIEPAPVYYCGSEEHAHAETCYAEDGSISCEFTEHTHTEECLIAPEATAEPTPAPVYYCGSEEHAHAETCYAENGSIVCEFTEHTHSEDCLLPPPIILQLTLDQTSVFAGDQPIMLRAQVAGGVAPYTVEFSHTSTGTAQADAPAVYARRMVAEPQTESTQLTESGVADFAYQPEAAGTHTLAITVTDAAGTQAQAVTSLSVAQHDYHETEEDFLSSIAAATLTDNIRKNIAAIAATQLGYTESTTDFIVDEAGQQQGYTRFGAWAQQPYTPWSASFVQFCLHYAGSAQTPVADAAALAAQLTATAQYRAADAYVPLAGDVVFFDWDEDGLADHTGLIANAYPSENGYTIETIEGDVDGAVITRSFVPQSTPSIVGYGQTAENPIQLLVDDVIAQIDAMPSADEFDAAMLAYEDAEDYEGLEAWYMQTTPQIRQAYYAYHALGASRQYAVTNAAKLLELEYVWSAATLELTPEVTRYCGLEEHAHGVDCYDQYGNLVCTLTVHTHTADCEVDPNIYYCGFEAHQHSEACLDENGMYGCLLVNHTHDESCLVQPEITYNCGQVAHSHSIEYGCYAADGTTLLCQVAPHTHSEPCSGILYCGYPADYEHTHGSCYQNFKITCTTPAHTHSYVCSLQPQYCVDPTGHSHTDTCEDGCLLHGHVLSCWVNPASSGISTDPEGTLAGATRFHSNVFLKYQATSHTVSSYEIGLFVLIPGVAAESSTWLPNTRQWSGSSDANYVLAYCSDDRTFSSKKGEFYDSYTMDSSRFTNDETRRKVAAIIGHSYPFLTADEMRAQLKAAYDAGLTVDSNGNLIDVSDSVEADWIGATQWALWDTTSTFGHHPVNEVDIDDFGNDRPAAFPGGHERYCINPLTDVGYADVATSRQKLSAIHSWLMSLQEPIELKVENYTYSTDQNSDGTYNLTVNVTLNRAIVEGENTVFQLVAGNTISTLETLPIGQQTFSISLQNISLADLMKSKVHLKVDGKHMQAYFFDSENYQDMLGGNWEYYEDDLSFDVGEKLLSISVTKKWNEGIPQDIDSVTVQLYADGVPVGDPVQIGKDNSWYYVWKDLYKRNASDKVIDYTIVETAIDGYYSSLTSAGAMEELATITYWKEVDTFSGPGEYIFMSPFGALTASWFEAKKDYYMNVSPCDISVVNDKQIKSVWTVTYDSESGGYYVQSKAYPGQYMNAYADAIRSTGTVYSFANSHLKSGSNYFRSFYSNGYQVYTTNESLAMDFKLYKLTTETIKGEELNFQLTNTRITELDELVKVSVTKEWAGRHDDLYPTQVQVQLYQDERAYGDPVTLTADSETPWAYTWPLLPGTVNVGTVDEHTFTYTVQEVEIAGYQPTVTSLEPIVEEDGTKVYSFTVTNTWQPLVGEFSFTKADKMNPAVGLADAVFDLYIAEAAASETTTYLPGVDMPVRLYASGLASGENGTVQVTHQGTDENGQAITISGLELGETYYLVETKAPAGYNLLPSPIGFAVDVNGSASLLDDAAGWAATADADGLSHLTVYNKSGFVLPETGGTGTLPYTAGGLLIIATASLLLYIQFKRRGEGTTA